jgi:hypothetical protein
VMREQNPDGWCSIIATRWGERLTPHCGDVELNEFIPPPPSRKVQERQTTAAVIGLLAELWPSTFSVYCANPAYLRALARRGALDGQPAAFVSGEDAAARAILQQARAKGGGP